MKKQRLMDHDPMMEAAAYAHTSSRRRGPPVMPEPPPQVLFFFQFKEFDIHFACLSLVPKLFLCEDFVLHPLFRQLFPFFVPTNTPPSFIIRYNITCLIISLTPLLSYPFSSPAFDCGHHPTGPCISRLQPRSRHCCGPGAPKAGVARFTLLW